MNGLSSPSDTGREPRSSSFLPIVLLAVSLIITFGWNLVVAMQSRNNGVRLRTQNVKAVDQAKKIQNGVKTIGKEILDLSATDEDAKALVKKYGIQQNNPAAAANPAGASPSASPAAPAPAGSP